MTEGVVVLERQPCVYLLASGPRGYLYIGVTSDLVRRVLEHRAGIRSGWAKERGCVVLVRYELFERMEDAIAREKQLKNWHRGWKQNLVEEQNPHWQDLAVGLGFDPLPGR
jgi:putative endonuclease